MEKSTNVILLVRTIGIVSILLGIYLAISRTNFQEYFYPIMIGASLIAASFQTDKTRDGKSNCTSISN